MKLSVLATALCLASGTFAYTLQFRDGEDQPQPCNGTDSGGDNSTCPQPPPPCNGTGNGTDPDGGDGSGWHPPSNQTCPPPNPPQPPPCNSTCPPPPCSSCGGGGGGDGGGGGGGGSGGGGGGGGDGGGGGGNGGDGGNGGGDGGNGGGQTLPVTYDQIYDNSGDSLNMVACSNGQNGLITKGFSTFGSLPHFPYIGGAQAVAGWNSPNCGSCWQLTYNGVTINVLAIDYSASGFNIALEAMNKLTNGNAVQLGKVDVQAQQVANSVCGL